MLESGDLKKGRKLEMDGEPYVIVQFEFVKPGKGQGQDFSIRREIQRSEPGRSRNGIFIFRG
jgi:translation elongation factor P/translation initiation factor 5A